MEHKIHYRPSYALLQVILNPNEQVVSEGGAMASMSSNIKIETSRRDKGVKGFLKGLKRMVLGGESFFQNTFTAEGAAGEVTFAPKLPGDIVHKHLEGNSVFVQGGGYLACTPGITVDAKFKGLKGFFSGIGAFMLKISGQGDVWLSSFGAIIEKDVDGTFTVDTGHIVAFDDTMEYKVRRLGGWKAFFLSGEGLVSEFKGRGRVWIQSRNPGGFGRLLGRLLPPK